MSSSACILAHFADQEKLIPAVTALSVNDAITRWDAVDGHVHLVAWGTDLIAARDSISSLEGVEQVTALEITKAGNTPQIDPAKCHAYLFIELDSTKGSAVLEKLTGMPEVISCSSARGGCDLIVMVSAETFSRVDTIVREQIQPLDGILRLKQNRIIDLKQL